MYLSGEAKELALQFLFRVGVKNKHKKFSVALERSATLFCASSTQ